MQELKLSHLNCKSNPFPLRLKCSKNEWTCLFGKELKALLLMDAITWIWIWIVDVILSSVNAVKIKKSNDMVNSFTLKNLFWTDFSSLVSVVVCLSILQIVFFRFFVLQISDIRVILNLNNQPTNQSIHPSILFDSISFHFKKELYMNRIAYYVRQKITKTKWKR